MEISSKSIGYIGIDQIETNQYEISVKPEITSRYIGFMFDRKERQRKDKKKYSNDKIKS